MSKELKLADTIMKEANSSTNWMFSIMFMNDKYMVGTSLTKEDGQVMNIIFEIHKSKVVISLVLPKFIFEKETVQREFDAFGLQVDMEGNSGELLTIKHSIPFEDIEKNTSIVLDIMEEMVFAMTEVVVNN